jgi:hypothetical protein
MILAHNLKYPFSLINNFKNMKTVKKFMLVAVATIFSVSFANAQFGLQAGYNANQLVSGGLSENLSGFHVGPTVNLGVQGPVGLELGLLYNYNQSKNYSFVGATGNYVKHSIELPARIAATFPLAGAVKLSLFAGPNFAYGLASKVTANAGIGSFDLDVYEADSNLSRFNLQLGGGAALHFKSFGVRVSYDYGMISMHKNYDLKENSLKAGLFFNF